MNSLKLIEIGEKPTIYALIAVKDGKEGLVALGHGILIPCVITEERLLPAFRDMGKSIAEAGNITVKILKFSVREDLEEFSSPHDKTA